MRTRTRWGWFAAIVIGALIVGNAAQDDDGGGGGRRLTPTEAACSMLRDGESPDLAYEVMKDVLADHEYTVGDVDLAARLAVNNAVDQGC